MPHQINPLLLATSPVAAKRSGRRKLSELVSNHFICHEHAGEVSSIVNQERMADELGCDRRSPRPGFDRLLSCTHLVDLLQQLFIDVRSLFK